MVNGRAWSRAEAELVRQAIDGPAQELAKQLNRTPEAILFKAQKLRAIPRGSNR